MQQNRETLGGNADRSAGVVAGVEIPVTGDGRSPPDEFRLKAVVPVNQVKAQLKRRHHYVWQYYLRAWAVDDVVSCLRGDTLFKSGTVGLGVKKDLYRMNDLSSEEIDFVRRVTLESASPLLRSVNEGWFSVFLGPSALEKLAGALTGEAPDLAAAVAQAVSNTEEDLHATIEAESIPHLDSLRTGDLTFLDTAGDRGAFLHFLCVQYFRTLKVRENVFAAIGDLPGIRPGHVWPLMSHIFATNVSLGLLNRWEQTRVTLLVAPPGSEFITTDQPVVNTHALGVGLLDPVEELSFLYPVSPTVALEWDSEAGARSTDVQTLNATEVDAINLALLSNAHEQAYATNTERLQALKAR